MCSLRARSDHARPRREPPIPRGVDPAASDRLHERPRYAHPTINRPPAEDPCSILRLNSRARSTGGVAAVDGEPWIGKMGIHPPDLGKRQAGKVKKALYSQIRTVTPCAREELEPPASWRATHSPCRCLPAAQGEPSTVSSKPLPRSPPSQTNRPSARPRAPSSIPPAVGPRVRATIGARARASSAVASFTFSPAISRAILSEEPPGHHRLRTSVGPEGLGPPG